jgi:hypothetical protein
MLFLLEYTRELPIFVSSENNWYNVLVQQEVQRTHANNIDAVAYTPLYALQLNLH